MKHSFTLKDHSEDDGREIAGVVTIEHTSNTVSIALDGFGTKDSVGGSIIFLELWDGKVQLSAWPDINCVEPVTMVLNGAAESNFDNPEDE